MYQKACGRPRERGLEGTKSERFPMAIAGGKHGMGALPPSKWSKAKLVEAFEEQESLVQKLRSQIREDARTRPRHKKINGPESLKNPVVRSKSHSGLAASTVVLCGYIPWYSMMGVSAAFERQWSPLFSSTEFVAAITMLVTWINSELDNIFGRS